MRVIVPLAGPDFVRDDGSLKAMIDLNGEPTVEACPDEPPMGTQGGID